MMVKGGGGGKLAPSWNEITRLVKVGLNNLIFRLLYCFYSKTTINLKLILTLTEEKLLVSYKQENTLNHQFNASSNYVEILERFSVMYM